VDLHTNSSATSERSKHDRTTLAGTDIDKARRIVTLRIEVLQQGLQSGRSQLTVGKMVCFVRAAGLRFVRRNSVERGVEHASVAQNIDSRQRRHRRGQNFGANLSVQT
jgi:hypothetical protein